MKLKVGLGILGTLALLLGIGFWNLGLQHWVLGVRGAVGLVNPSLSYPAASRISPQKTARGAGLVLHGLNLDPGKMAALSDVLVQQGILVFQGALGGHRVNIDEYQNVTRSVWLAEVQELFRLARAEQPSGPMICLGFSLGALLILDAQAQGLISCDKMILFAPAVATHVPLFVIQLAQKIIPEMFTLPTAVPAEYRRHDKLVMKPNFLAAESMQALNAASVTALDIPTVVLMSPDDEVVSFAGVLDWIGQRNLANWKLETVLVSPEPPRRPIHHLIIDEASVGALEWKRILHVIHRFLN